MFRLIRLLFVLTFLIAVHGYGYGTSFVYGSGRGAYSGGNIPVSIQSRHTMRNYDVPSSGYAQPVAIEIGSRSIPVTIIFRSASSHINVHQDHVGSRGSVQETSSEDEPHRLYHSVTKPIYQEIREIIVPSRRIVQEIHPVKETIHTVVSRGIGGRVDHSVGDGDGYRKEGY